MASKRKQKTILIRLLNRETGYFYIQKKNPRNQPEKRQLRKYCPKARQHVVFEEAKA